MNKRPPRKVDILIIGAGISGLTTAYYLDKKGYDIVLLESQSFVGGNIKSSSKEGFVCENGPNTILNNNKYFNDLINHLGISKKIIYPNKNLKKRFLINKGKLMVIPLTVFGFIKSSLISLKGKFRLFFEIFVKKHDANTSVYDFINSRFGKEFQEIFIEPFIAGIYAGNTKNMSVKHTMKRLWDAEQKDGSIILNFIKNFNNKNISKSLTFEKGISSLVNEIHKNLDKIVVLNSKVTNINKSNGRYFVDVNNNQTYSCEKIVSTIPSYNLSKIIYDSNFSSILKKINYCPLLVIHISLEKTKINVNIDGFGVLTKPADCKSFLGILFNSRIFPHVAPPGKELLTVMVGGDRQKEIFNDSKQSIIKKNISEIRQLLSYSADIKIINYYYWRNAIPQYSLEHDLFVTGVKNFEKNNKNFYLLGNFIKGVSVSDCIKNAMKLSLNI